MTLPLQNRKPFSNGDANSSTSVGKRVYLSRNRRQISLKNREKSILKKDFPTTMPILPSLLEKVEEFFQQIKQEWVRGWKSMKVGLESKF